MNNVSNLQAILLADPLRWRMLSMVRSLQLPDCWIGAGVLRNAVWDQLHGRVASRPDGDVDVLWFAADRAAPSEDRRVESALRRLDPALDWSVKNQARMHRRNGDPAYTSTVNAMRHWPETATAVAARLTPSGQCEIAAPFGLDDLFSLVLRPTPRFAGEKYGLYLDRVRTKQWLTTWPLLRMQAAVSA